MRGAGGILARVSRRQDAQQLLLPVCPTRDLPRLRAWLHTPEVARWWGDPDEQAAMLAEDLTEPGMVMRNFARRKTIRLCAGLRR